MLPAMWSVADLRKISESLAGAIINTLRPVLAYVDFSGAGGGAPVLALATRDEPPPALRDRIGQAARAFIRTHDPEEVFQFDDPDHPTPLRVTARPIGFGGEHGVIAVAFDDPSAPTRAHQTLLQICAAQANCAVQSATILRNLRASEDQVREANAELAGHVAELQRINDEMRSARLAALNVMEDAVEARRRVEALNLDLRREASERRRAEEALRESEQRFRTMADTAPAIIWVTEPDGECSFLSKSWRDYTGQSEPESLGRGWLSAIYIGDRHHAWETFLAANRSHTPFHLDYRLRRADGEFRWVSCAGHPRFDQQGRFAGFIGSVFDVHERKRIEERDQFLVFLDDAVRPLTEPDEIPAAAARLLGQRLRVNRCAYAEVGPDQDAFTVVGDHTRGAESFVGSYNTSDFGEDCRRSLRDGETFIVEDAESDPQCAGVREAYAAAQIRAVICAPLLKSGRLVATMAVHSTEARRWRPEEAELVRAVAARCWESIERARVARSLRESEERFRTLADNISQFAWMADENWWIFWYNQRWYDYTGTTFEQMQGWGWTAVHHPDHVDRVVESVKQAWRTGEPWEQTFPLRSRDGEYRWFLSRAHPIRDASGRVVRWFGTNTDITERLAIEAELEQHKAELEKRVEERTRELSETYRRLRLSERLAMMGTLSAGLGHDMANLLLPVRVRLESLSHEDLSEQAREDLNAIGVSAEYLRRLANGLRLLALDPDRAPQGEATDLASWWEDARGVLHSVLPRTVSLEADLAAADRPVHISRPALTQIVFNLVQNAGDAMRDRPSGSVVVRARTERDRVLLSVSDDGPGMSAEVQARCMEPFFTTKTRGISTGLGLVLVYGLTRDAGGSVQLESELGKGTTFTIRLPLQEQQPRTDSQTRQAVLLRVRDDRIRSFLTGELRSLGFDAVSTRNSRAPAFSILDDPRDLDAQPESSPVILLAPTGLRRTNLIALGDRPGIPAIRQALREQARACRADAGREAQPT